MKKITPEMEKIYHSLKSNPLFFHKLRMGWNIIWQRYLYSPYFFSWRLLIYPVLFLPLLLFVVLPWIFFVDYLKIEILKLFLLILVIPSLIFGIILVLLLANYCFVHGFDM